MKSLTLSQAIEAFLLEKEGQRLSPNTSAEYRVSFRKLQKYLGDPDFATITLDQMRGFMAELAKPSEPAGIAPRPAKVLSNKTVRTYEMTADGIYRFGFTVHVSLGQATDFSYQIKADLHNPQLTVPASLVVDEGGTVALQAQAEDAAGGVVDIDWDLDNDGDYETTDEQTTFSAAGIDGPAAMTIGVRAKDVAGRITAANTTVSVLNVALTVAIDAVTNANEGDVISLGSSVADAGDAEHLTYDWRVTSYGVEVATSDQAYFTLTAADSGPFDVSLTVAEVGGGQGTATHTIYVANVAPTPSITGAPATNSEGAAINLTASATDPNSADQAAGFSYSWTVTRGMDNLATGTEDTFSFTPEDDGSYSVTLEALDKDGDTGSVTQDISVDNVAPTLSNLAVSSATVDEGGSVTLTGDVGDAGTADSLSIEIDWGDGSAAETVSLPAGSSFFNVIHTYADDNPTGTASDTTRSR